MENVRKAVQRQSRPPRGPFSTGDYVFYWRKLRDGKGGGWKGPARVIGFFNENKIWVSHGNKVLRCSPEQLKKLSEDQLAAVTYTTQDLLAKISSKAKRGAQVFTDITREGHPDDKTPDEDGDERGESRAVKRQRTGGGVGGSGDLEMETGHEGDERDESPEGANVANIPIHESEEETTMSQVVATDQSMGDEQDSHGDDATPEVEMASPNSTGANLSAGATNIEEHHVSAAAETGGYGPIRTSSLTRALQRSVDVLDHGYSRVPRTQMAVSQETRNEVFETFMAQLESSKEVRDCELTPKEREMIAEGKRCEWENLLNYDAIKVYTGHEAEDMKKRIPPERFLESRFVKTRKIDPETPGGYKIKCRWCIIGYKDPDLLELDRQSPTLSMDAYIMCLQVISSKQWTLMIADVEGAFLQGEPLRRNRGKIYVKLPKEGVPGQSSQDVVEILKTVYGLADAPRAWWFSFSNTLRQLGMKQSELDPCVFFWFHEQELQGIIVLHVDDMVVGGSGVFHERVISRLKQRYPFKHWNVGEGMSLGKRLKQQEDFSIVCDQREYAEKVQTIPLTRERRKNKQGLVTETERKKLRGVIGAANWLCGNTRPDIAVATAFLQQKVQCATVNELIEANK